MIDYFYVNKYCLVEFQYNFFFPLNQVIIDENDEKLEDLRLKWGEEIYEVVTDALLEIKENGTSCFELWNFAEERKASIDEAIKCLLQKLQKTHKLADTRTPTITKG